MSLSHENENDFQFWLKQVEAKPTGLGQAGSGQLKIDRS